MDLSQYDVFQFFTDVFSLNFSTRRQSVQAETVLLLSINVHILFTPACFLIVLLGMQLSNLLGILLIVGIVEAAIKCNAGMCSTMLFHV